MNNFEIDSNINSPKGIESESEDQKKTKYFSDLALSVKDAFRLHKKFGQLTDEEGKRPWGNVSEHCLVEVARVKTLAELLNLDSHITKDLMYAAALHDISKRREKV